jgi:release factor glutamine methyltransferase
MTIDIGQWLSQARGKLARHSDQPQRESRALLGTVLHKPLSWIIAHPEAELTADQQFQLDNLLARLIAGEPLPYLLGRWEYFGLEFAITPAVLIPRPETELLVEQAIHWLNLHPTCRQAADVGAGSGCITISLAYHVRDLFVTAIELSPAALDVAQQNVRAYGLQDRVTIVLADLLENEPGAFHLVCANLPYIPTYKLAGLDVARYEPVQALDGGSDGLVLIERLLATLPSHLAPGGLALLEIESGQGETALAIASQYFPSANISVLRDLSDLPRIVRIEN